MLQLREQVSRTFSIKRMLSKLSKRSEINNGITLNPYEVNVDDADSSTLEIQESEPHYATGQENPDGDGQATVNQNSHSSQVVGSQKERQRQMPNYEEIESSDDYEERHNHTKDVVYILETDHMKREICRRKHFRRQLFYDAVLILERFHLLFDVLIPLRSISQLIRGSSEPAWCKLYVNGTPVMVKESFVNLKEDKIFVCRELSRVGPNWTHQHYTEPGRDKVGASKELMKGTETKEKEVERNALGEYRGLAWTGKFEKLYVTERFIVNSDASCGICFDSILECASLRRLPCQHTFHEECIRNWLFRDVEHPCFSAKKIIKREMQKYTCPCCRFNVYLWVFEGYYKPSFARHTVKTISIKTILRFWREFEKQDYFDMLERMQNGTINVYDESCNSYYIHSGGVSRAGSGTWPRPYHSRHASWWRRHGTGWKLLDEHIVPTGTEDLEMMLAHEDFSVDTSYYFEEHFDERLTQ